VADIEQLKLKRISVLNQIHQLGVHLARLHLQDNKLYIEGACGSEATKNRIWGQVKLVDPSYSDLILHLTINLPWLPWERTYIVAAGDSLSKIAKHFYGNASEYIRIFEANRDRLNDPNAIRVGQQLVIPT